MSQTQTIRLPDDVVLEEFRPVAYFDKHMDCIRVLTHDRSVTEHRVNEFFTVYESNNRGDFDPQYVGFAIKGVKHLFNKVGLSLDKPHKLADIIDRLVKYSPGSVMSVTLDLIFSQYAATGDLNIDFEDQSKAA